MIPELRQGLDDILQLAAAIIDHADMATKCLGQSDFRDDLALVGMDKRMQSMVMCATTIKQLADALKVYADDLDAYERERWERMEREAEEAGE